MTGETDLVQPSDRLINLTGKGFCFEHLAQNWGFLLESWGWDAPGEPLDMLGEKLQYLSKQCSVGSVPKHPDFSFTQKLSFQMNLSNVLSCNENF